MKKSGVLYLLAAAAAFSISSVKADTLADWGFETSKPATAGPFAPESELSLEDGIAFASGSHASGAAVYSTPAGNGSTNSFSANTWAVNDYWQFTISTAGYSDISLSYDQTGSATGPGNFFFEYSTDGGANFTTESPYGVILSTWSPTVPHTGFTFSYDLSSITALDDDSSVVFRIVDDSTTSINGGTVATSGTDRIDNFVVSGTADAVPEPSSMALTAVGGLLGLVTIRRKR